MMQALDELAPAPQRAGPLPVVPADVLRCHFTFMPGWAPASGERM